jgi:hypothetical protein
MVEREMQIVRTEFVYGTSRKGMPATRVTFRGGGGESVIVEMRGKAGSDDAAVESPRAALVQAAMFGKPVSDASP